MAAAAPASRSSRFPMSWDAEGPSIPAAVTTIELDMAGSPRCDLNPCMSPAAIASDRPPKTPITDSIVGKAHADHRTWPEIGGDPGSGDYAKGNGQLPNPEECVTS